MRPRRVLWAAWDVLLATAIVAVAEVEIATGATYGHEPVWPGPPAITRILVALLAVPVLLRRLRPRVALVAGSALLLVDALALGGTQSGVGFVFLAVLLYSAAAHIRLLWPTLAAAAVLLLAIGTRPGAVQGVGDLVFFLGMSALPIVLGRAVQLHLRQVAVLERQREELVRLHAAEVAAATAAERAAIARELHDIVAHAVSVVVIQAQAGARILRADPDRTEAALASIEASGRDALTELRRLLSVLTAGADGDAATAPAPRIADIAALVERMRDAGLEVDLAQEPVPPLAAAAELAVHRTVQESLTNALKHAPGRPVSVRISAEGGDVAVVVRNPVPPTRTASSLPSTARGLIGMRERIALVGGVLATGVVDGVFTVDARVPSEAGAR